MRLIDADQLIMDLSDYALQESPNDNMDDEEKDLQSQIYAAIMFCIDFVEQTKTAYDVDKVVEELEENALVKECDVGGLVPSREKIVILSDAIEIIKEGGTDETI